jgi:hypothetical protein
MLLFESAQAVYEKTGLWMGSGAARARIDLTKGFDVRSDDAASSTARISLTYHQYSKNLVWIQVEN